MNNNLAKTEKLILIPVGFGLRILLVNGEGYTNFCRAYMVRTGTIELSFSKYSYVNNLLQMIAWVSFHLRILGFKGLIQKATGVIIFASYRKPELMVHLLKYLAQEAKSELRDRIAAFNKKPVMGHGEFSKRIKQRHSTFWQSPDSKVVKNTVLHASDPIEKWRDVSNWQRKLSNKKNAREFAKKHGCKVPVLCWWGRDINEIDFNNLPNQFVLKPTIGHSSKHVYLMNKGINMLDNRFYSSKELSKIMAAELDQNPYLEFLIEEFVRTEEGGYKIPVNYKLHTFNGVIAGINVINRAGPKEGFMRAYDENWNAIKDISNDFPKAPYQDPPRCLDEMIEHAKKLSRAYEIYVRLDFFATDKGAIFGEFTPTPSVGDYFTREADKMFIKYWDKHCKGMI